jgi:hypothetical protein
VSLCDEPKERRKTGLVSPTWHLAHPPGSERIHELVMSESCAVREHLYTMDMGEGRPLIPSFSPKGRSLTRVGASR